MELFKFTRQSPWTIKYMIQYSVLTVLGNFFICQFINVFIAVEILNDSALYKLLLTLTLALTSSLSSSWLSDVWVWCAWCMVELPAGRHLKVANASIVGGQNLTLSCHYRFAGYSVYAPYIQWSNNNLQFQTLAATQRMLGPSDGGWWDRVSELTVLVPLGADYLPKYTCSVSYTANYHYVSRSGRIRYTGRHSWTTRRVRLSCEWPTCSAVVSLPYCISLFHELAVLVIVGMSMCTNKGTCCTPVTCLG